MGVLRGLSSSERRKDRGARSRRDEAHAMLANIYNWFTEGFDTPANVTVVAVPVSSALSPPPILSCHPGRPGDSLWHTARNLRHMSQVGAAASPKETPLENSDRP